MIPLTKIIITTHDIQEVTKVLRSGYIIEGPVTHQLEKQFNILCNTKYAIAVNSGTAALHAALYAIGIEPGDEVITTPFTFVATANAICMRGAKPVFVDIEPATFNIDPNLIEKAITKKTKAILVVNLFGHPADYNRIMKIARKNKLIVVEDAAQSINASYRGKKSGSLGHISCFSLYATKNIMCGEGGMITTNNKRFYERALLFKNHGQPKGKKYDYVDIGYNYRLTDIHAALALAQMKRIESITKKRQTIAQKYHKGLADIQGLLLPTEKKYCSHVYHQYTIIIEQGTKRRSVIRNYLERKGIQSTIYYPKPLYMFKHLYQSTRYARFPHTQAASQQVLSIPISPHLTANEINYIIDTLHHI